MIGVRVSAVAAFAQKPGEARENPHCAGSKSADIPQTEIRWASPKGLEVAKSRMVARRGRMTLRIGSLNADRRRQRALTQFRVADSHGQTVARIKCCGRHPTAQPLLIQLILGFQLAPVHFAFQAQREGFFALPRILAKKPLVVPNADTMLVEPQIVDTHRKLIYIGITSFAEEPPGFTDRPKKEVLA